ncbi:MAG TPA: HAMP domain-containing sensor histidine kinase [Ideonella sp.]|nr:HAMP domain-containing sensor histidine kinase [Ideonella sp.]
MSALPSGVPLLRRLHVRITLVVLALLIAMCSALLMLARHYSMQTAQEASQRINLDLAAYIVEHQPRPLIGADGRADTALLKGMATQVMMINPAVEVYLLDPQGRVLGHALDGAAPISPQIDLAPVHALLDDRSARAMLPLWGDDPRRAGQRNIFSAAPVRRDGQLAGYLYVVLQGLQTQTLTESLERSGAMRQMALGLALALLLAGGALVVALVKLTRPLRELAEQVQAFRADPAAGLAAEAPLPDGDEIAVLRSATQQMQQRIAQQFAAAEDSDRMRRELVSNISHDLHTPLASIQGYVETLLLRGDQLDAAAREQHLRVVLRHATRLGKRIADLFELSKLDAGRVEAQREVFCLAELLQDVIQSYQLPAQQQGIRLSLAEGSHLQAQVMADIALIERVLQNLIDNALRHTPQGGAISVGVVSEGEQLRVSIADTGSGIAQQHLPHVFERYWRASDAQSTEPGSNAGLGLAIVKRILDLHGSVVRVQSAPGQGTRFEFCLPQVG